MNKLVFRDIEVSKKQFYESKKSIKLSDADVGKIVLSNKIKGNNETVKYFIDYIDQSIVPLCLLLPQMSGWIKYFENGGKNMSFKIDEDWIYLKCNEIWNKIKELLKGITLGSNVIYDDQYIKTKVTTFSEVIKNLFDGGKIPKEIVEYTCIHCISIDSVLRVDTKYHLQVTSLFRTV